MKMSKILSIWEQRIEDENKSKILKFINSEDLTFFFQFEDEYYAASEDSRLTFAKLKVPDEDYHPSWDEEASFLAFNVTRGIKEDNVPKKLFYKKDLKDIKVLNKEDIEKILK